jgi:hypothetical protein
MASDHREINASKLMWQFFKRYRLPAVFSK